VRDLLPTLALSPAEAAGSIGVSESWLRVQMRQGGLPFSRVGGRVLIQPRKLAEWLDRHEERNEETVKRAMAVADRAAPRVQAS
jgi:excisionase family DNA binding protein